MLMLRHRQTWGQILVDEMKLMKKIILHIQVQ